RHTSRIVVSMTSRRRVLAGLVGGVLAAAATLALAGNDLYGKPLRGLSPVAIAELKQAPERYREKTVRVVGTASAGSAQEVTVSEGGASLVVRTDGSFS